MVRDAGAVMQTLSATFAGSFGRTGDGMVGLWRQAEREVASRGVIGGLSVNRAET